MYIVIEMLLTYGIIRLHSNPVNRFKFTVTHLQQFTTICMHVFSKYVHVYFSYVHVFCFVRIHSIPLLNIDVK